MDLPRFVPRYIHSVRRWASLMMAVGVLGCPAPASTPDAGPERDAGPRDGATDAAPSDAAADAAFDSGVDAGPAPEGDADGDGLTNAEEIGDDPSAPRDTDGDGTPDYLDRDSDGDTILDADERVDTWRCDRAPPVRNVDADADGIPDREEAGDADPETPPRDTDADGVPDFLDPDSDDDAVWDVSERLLNTEVRNRDTDADGTDDLVELLAGTDARDPSDDPDVRSWLVSLIPFRGPADPPEVGGPRYVVPAAQAGAEVRVRARDVSGGAERVVGLALDGESEGCDAVAGLDTDDDGLPDAVASAAAGDRLCWTFSVLPNRTIPGETRFPIAEECTTRVASLDALLEVLVDGEVMRSVTFKALLPPRVLCLAPDDPRDFDCPEPDPCNVCCGC